MKRIALCVFVAFIFVRPVVYAQIADNQVKIVRDTWGIPHIFAENEYALFYGAGYAAAEDRLLQMNLVRLSVQGRLSEVFGNRFLIHDKRMRTLGLYTYAQQSTIELPDTVRMWLDAYANGVNAYMQDNPGHLAEVFAAIRILPEPWTAADCMAAWLRIAEYFDRGWTNEVTALRKFENMLGPMSREDAIDSLERQRYNIDDDAAIVSKAEYERYDEEFAKLSANLPRIEGENSGSALPGPFSKTGVDEEWEPPKMSHDWVVGGAKSTTGLPILESDPQITVESPPTWYEFHLHGGRFNVRGISMPGTPAMLLGFSENCAWGLTALGSDNADLFEEKLKPGSRNEYEWMGGYETMTEHNEIIKVKGGSDVVLTVQETRHGPVVNEFCNGVQQGEAFALHWLILQEPETSMTGLFEMMAAHNWPEFVDGMRKYRSPGVHLIYGDRHNTIAYYTMSRIPLRAHNANIPFQGWTGAEEWQGTVPFDEMPRMLNPAQHFISTANNLPVGSWYPYAIGGGIGHNARSWRLVELMTGTDIFAPEDFFDVHRDAVQPIARDFVYFALKAVEEENPRDADVQAAAALLENWDFRQVTSNDVYRMTSVIGATIKRSLRNTPLESRYLGSDAGLVQLFLDLEAYEDSTGNLTPDPDIRAWLIDQLGEVYRASGIGNGGRPLVLTHEMPFQDNLENFGSLYEQYNQTSPPLHCGDGGTIWSQIGNSYSQLVNLAEVDSSYSVIPPGNSEVPESGYFDNQVPIWADGSMHAAPLSADAVDNNKDSESVLTIGTTSVDPPQLARGIEITAVYPNPLTDAAVIRAVLESESHIGIVVRDALGRVVQRQDSGLRGRGVQYFTWQPAADLPEGSYFITVSAGGEIQTVRVIRRTR